MSTGIAFVSLAAAVSIPSGLEFLAAGLKGISQNVERSFFDWGYHASIKGSEGACRQARKSFQPKFIPFVSFLGR
jgi:hypothetical protein